MYKISRENVFFEFNKENKPILEVNPGEDLIIETDDCFRSQIKSENDLVTDIDFSKVNPATGPIAVKGAMPGDILVVDIMDILVDKKGFMVAIPEEGAFGHHISEPVTRVINIEDGFFIFSNDMRFPLNPMIGVIGVTPSGNPIPCGEIGNHGGNMDAKIIQKGSKLYFKVQVEGALFGLGDVHAGMGDGEAVICGVEIPSSVTLRLDLIKKPLFVPERPIVETRDRVICIGHGKTMDEASEVALEDMLKLITNKTDLNETDASMLISAVGDLKVCQIVDPQKTMRVEVPKSIFSKKGEYYL